MLTKIKKGMKDPILAAKLLQIRSGLYLGHSDYRKFIVLSRSRTGSNLLIDLMNTHPMIYAEGEIFSSLEGRTANQILETIYSRYPKYIKVVGFKIFYYHPQDDESGLIWELLKEMEDLIVIHLKRRNILRTLLSRKIAGITNAYRHDLGKDHSDGNKRCSFTEDELLSGFEQTRGWEDDFGGMFQTYEGIEIYYEDMADNMYREFRRITKILNLKYREPRTTLKKQNPEKMYDLIGNYHELKEKFANTEWADFFDD